ncbi:MAG: ABC transporter substrate-binding protein [Mycetocola sp.]
MQRLTHHTTTRTSAFRRRANTLAGAALALTLAASLSACSATGSASTAAADADSGKATDIELVLGWYATPESGGFYAAEEQGYFEDANLNVTITPGGPSVSGTQIVAGGRAQMGISDAVSIARAQEEGIPIVAIAAMYQTNPVGVMVHADSDMESFEDMAGHTWVTQTGQVAPEYIKSTLGIDFDTQAYQGSIANFIADDSLVQQGWPTNEVYQASSQGVETRFFSYAESGYNPYNDVVFATEDYIAENPEAIKAFLEASMNGWADYIGDIDAATAANEALLEANAEQSEESVWFAWDKQREYITAGDGAAQLGAMSDERWSTLVDQMLELDQIAGEIDPATLFDASFLPEVAAPSDLPAAPTGSY